MDPNSQKSLESFVRSFEQVAETIKERNPDCIIAPMFGAVPFIDILNIVDDEFPNHKVMYVPASNKVYRLREVLRAVFEKVIQEKAPDGGSFLSIDEVISGNSLQRVFKQFDAARVNYANRRTVELYGENTDFRKDNVAAYRDNLRDSIRYNSIGIVDSRMKRKGKSMSKGYTELIDRGIVLPIDTECIITMDRMEFFPARYKIAKDCQGKKVHLPVVTNFNINPKYVDFLGEVAAAVGKDPAEVTVSNLVKIRDSYQLVPEELRKL